MVKIHLMIIGDEILSGRTQESNGRFLSKFLYSRGFPVSRTTIIRDDDQTIQSSVQKESAKCEVLILSGGLGPTVDDKTAESLKKAFSEISPREIPNPVGSASGLLYQVTHKEHTSVVMALPGVPREFRLMWEEEAYPLVFDLVLKEKCSHRETLTFRTKLLPEKKVASLIDQEKLLSNPSISLSFYPYIGGVDLQVHLNALSGSELFALKEYALNSIKNSKLQEFIWQIGEKSIEELIVELLQEHNLTLGLAESATGGLISSKITDAPGSSKVFTGSYICYQNEFKENVLGVKQTTLKEFSNVSKEVAFELAHSTQEKLNSDFTCAVTGYAGPAGDDVGKCALAIATRKDQQQIEIETFEHHCKGGDRTKLKEHFAQLALCHILEKIKEKKAQ